LCFAFVFFPLSKFSEAFFRRSPPLHKIQGRVGLQVAGFSPPPHSFAVPPPPPPDRAVSKSPPLLLELQGPFSLTYFQFFPFLFGVRDFSWLLLLSPPPGGCFPLRCTGFPSFFLFFIRFGIGHRFPPKTGEGCVYWPTWAVFLGPFFLSPWFPLWLPTSRLVDTRVDVFFFSIQSELFSAVWFFRCPHRDDSSAASFSHLFVFFPSFFPSYKRGWHGGSSSCLNSPGCFFPSFFFFMGLLPGTEDRRPLRCCFRSCSTFFSRQRFFKRNSRHFCWCRTNFSSFRALSSPRAHAIPASNCGFSSLSLFTQGSVDIGLFSLLGSLHFVVE